MNNVTLKYSLVLATIGRELELIPFLDSLSNQTYKNFELIVIDQNYDDRIPKVLSKYKQVFLIKYFKSKPGLSLARNEGLKHLSGDIIAFPDDDCCYPKNLLKNVTELFNKNQNLDGIAGRVVNLEGKSSVSRWAKKPGIITKRNVWQRAVSISLFLRYQVINSVGGFDISLGAGSGTEWGSGEETDYLLRGLLLGYKISYFPELFVIHPEPTRNIDTSAILRAKKYGSGMGRVLRKHKYPFWFIIYFCFRSFTGALLALLKGNKHKYQFYIANLIGRASGWSAPL